MEKNIGFLFLVILFFFSKLTFAQVPVIDNISKKKGAVSERVEINGSGFGNDPAALIVYFGATKGRISSVSNNKIIAIVPPGATYDYISVTNIISRLTAFSKEFFSLSYGGEGFDINRFSAPLNFSGQSTLNNLCACDFDGDGKVDFATSTNSNSISIFHNTGSGNTLTFTRTEVSINSPSLSIACADLDGDGKRDIVVGQDNGSQFYIIKNFSTPGNFNFLLAGQPYFVTGRKIPQIRISDLNKDGKPEIVVVDEQQKQISIFQNESSGGLISFSFTPVNLLISEYTSTNGLAVVDITGNGLPDLAVSSAGNNKLAIYKNKSTSSTIGFEDKFFIQLDHGGDNLLAADFNQDGMNDLVLTSNSSAKVTVIINKSSSTTISFLEKAFSSNLTWRPVAIASGDIDGDGKVDLILTSQFESKLYFFLNKTTSDASFEIIEKQIPAIARHVRIADVTGNGLNDVIFSNGAQPNSRISILTNENCLVPKFIAPKKILTCDNPYRLEATSLEGFTYQWKKDGVVINNENNSFIDVTQSGNYSVTIASSDCNLSNNVDVVIIDQANSNQNLVDIYSERNGKLCDGGTLNLRVDDYFLSVKWVPENSSAREREISSPGIYKVEVEVSPNCFAKGEINISKVPNPPINVRANRTNVKEGENVQLIATGAKTYRWEPAVFLNNPNISNPTAQINETTKFTVTGTDDNGCSSESSITILVGDEIKLTGKKLFSPNGDGIDDFWTIENIEAFDGCTVTIFDGFGKKLFEKSGYENVEGLAWDGKSFGKNVPEGAYFYIINCGDKKAITGSITLIR
jgi:gliding motility-associated-like protein